MRTLLTRDASVVSVSPAVVEAAVFCYKVDAQPLHVTAQFADQNAACLTATQWTLLNNNNDKRERLFAVIRIIAHCLVV